MSVEKLKIGLLLEKGFIQNWKYNLIKDLFEFDFINISVVIFHEPKIHIKKSLFFKIHEYLDRLIFKKSISFDKKFNANSLLEGISNFDISSQNSLEYHKIIQSIDLILYLDNDFTFIQTLEKPPLGLWYYKVGNISESLIQNGSYYEVIQRMDDFKISLNAIIPSVGKIQIFSTALNLYPHSMHVNNNNAYFYAIDVIKRYLEKLHNNKEKFISELNIEDRSDKYSITIGNPGSFKSLRNLAKLIYNYLINKIQFSEKSFWSIYYSFSGHNNFRGSFNKFKKIKTRKDRFWADPFPIIKDGRKFIFFEELIFKEKLGHISVLELNDHGEIMSNSVIIKKPYHMSYPFLIELEDELYMIPETSGNKTIELYKCISFPNQWVFIMNLMENVTAKDTTLVFKDEVWWLFTSIKNPQNNCSELNIFYSSHLLTNSWIPHTRNPVNCDVSKERGAGQIFKIHERFYRPSQDCSGTYGKVVNINEIKILTKDDFYETRIYKIDPYWDKNLKGLHTFNNYQNFCVIDCLEKRSRIKNLFSK